MNKIALLGGLLLAGLVLLIAGQARLGQAGAIGTWSLAAGVLLLLAAAGLAWRQRTGRRRQPPLVGEYRGVLASEEGFVPLAGSGEELRQQVQRRIADQPQRAADSVRGLLEGKLKEPRAGAAGRAARPDTKKRRNSG